jgi:hypothetical protein
VVVGALWNVFKSPSPELCHVNHPQTESQHQQEAGTRRVGHAVCSSSGWVESDPQGILWPSKSALDQQLVKHLPSEPGQCQKALAAQNVDKQALGL